MRLIDADKMRENLLWCKEQSGSYNDVYWDDVIERLDVQPTVGGWISVKDRMPELGREVLVYAIGKIDGFIDSHVYAICSRFVQRIFPSAPGHEIWSTPWQYFHVDYEITHWMPLPESPKDGDA